MKKRLFAFLLAVVCVLSFAACTKKDTPQSLYAGAEQKFAEAKGYEAVSTIKMETVMGSMTNEETMEMTTKFNEGDMILSMDGEEIVYVDGMMYADMGEDYKIKVALTAEELTQYVGMSTDVSDLPELKEEVFADLEMVESENGNRSFTIALDKAAFEELMGETLASLTAGEDGMEIDLSDMTMAMVFDKDDNLVEMTIKFEMGMSMKGMEGIDMDATMSLKMEMKTEYKSIETPPTITAPADADTYEELNKDDVLY